LKFPLNLKIIDIACGYCGGWTYPIAVIEGEYNGVKQKRIRLGRWCEVPEHSKDIRQFDVRYTTYENKDKIKPIFRIGIDYISGLLKKKVLI
jgi:hypothetical protein